jgi:hypothetical protein
MRAYKGAIVVFAVAFIGIGITLLAVTAANGGGVLGFVLGALFVGLGAGRLTLLRKGAR